MVNKFLYPNGGSETYIFKLAEYLQSNGHEVQFFGMEDERNIVGNHAGQYTANMNFHGGKLQKLLYPFKIIYSFEARQRIRQVLDDFKPDVVHMNNINFQITPAIIDEIKKDNIRIVWTMHDYQVICPNHMMYQPATGSCCENCIGGKYGQCTRNRCIHGSLVKSLLGTIEAKVYAVRKTYGKVDSVICPSAFLEQKLLTNKIFQGKTLTLHNFIDQVACEETEKKEYVLYFGRFSTEKGLETLVKAAQLLPNVPFVLAGKGPLEESIPKLKNIKMVGFQTGKQLERLIREANMSVYPSEWYENCPFSVMESQMYETPVIGANIGGIPELIQNEKTGLLFEPGNAGELAEAIKKLWSDKKLQIEYQKNCQKIAFDTVEQYCDKLIKIYQG